MKNIFKLLIAVMFLFQIATLSAQQGSFYKYSFIKETKVKGPKIFYENLENTGGNSNIDVNKIIHKRVDFFFKTYSGTEKGNIQNHVAWTRDKALFEKVNSKADADVVIGGHYEILTHVDVEEKLFYERQSNVGGSIPYYEIRQTNTAEVNVVISYTYKDKFVDYDTIHIVKSYERKPKTKCRSIDELVAACEESLELQSYSLFKFYEVDDEWYKFVKVKTKDKGLKEELSTAKDLLVNGEIYKLGSIYKRIYEADNSNKEAAFNLAMCYELIGNYPKANEYYAKMPDFHAKVRMKDNMKLYNYLESIGANLLLKDF
jgi:hypothetical protein